MVSDAALDAWIARSWDTPPPWDRSVFREYHDAEMREVARARAESAEAGENAELRKQNRALTRRVRKLEQMVAPGGPLIGALADAVPKLIEQSLQASMVMRDGGVWNAEQSYTKGTACTHQGATWVAQTTAAPGDRPGKSSTWRLAIKSDEQALRRLLRDELRKQPVAR